MNKKYSEYKDSGVEWIGEIPAEWKCKKIRFVCSMQKGKNPDELLDEKISEEYFPYLSMEYLRGNNESLKYCKNNNGVLTDENDLLILWDGSNAGEIINSKKGVLSSTLAKIHNYKNNLKCLKYTLKAFETILKDMSIGMGIPHVDGDFLKNSLIPIPEIYEQSNIIDFLNKKTLQVDDLIAKKERMIELLKEERTAIINNAVTKGLDPNVKMKNSGIEWLGEIPKHWKLKRLKHLVKLINEVGAINNDGVRVDLENIESWTGQYLQNDSLPDENEEMKQFIMGDVLFNKLRPYLAKVFYAEKDGICGGELLVLRPSELMYPRFLYYRAVSNDFIRVIDGSTYGAKMPRASWDFIGNLFIPYPDKSEQSRIANHIDQKVKQITDQIDREQKSIELLKEYRTALISEVVTGKIDVRGE
jgi:type I restriction enzyme, S subunit